jgi:hypothetical protein
MHLSPHSSLDLVEKAQQVAERTSKSNSDAFQKIAMISMCTVAVTSAMHLMLQVWRDLHRDDHEHHR